jgi:hypothetical protein
LKTLQFSCHPQDLFGDEFNGCLSFVGFQFM